jgi:hypothetical protein
MSEEKNLAILLVELKQKLDTSAFRLASAGLVDWSQFNKAMRGLENRTLSPEQIDLMVKDLQDQHLLTPEEAASWTEMLHAAALADKTISMVVSRRNRETPAEIIEDTRRKLMMTFREIWRESGGRIGVYVPSLRTLLGLGRRKIEAEGVEIWLPENYVVLTGNEITNFLDVISDEYIMREGWEAVFPEIGRIPEVVDDTNKVVNLLKGTHSLAIYAFAVTVIDNKVGSLAAILIYKPLSVVLNDDLISQFTKNLSNQHFILVEQTSGLLLSRRYRVQRFIVESTLVPLKGAIYFFDHGSSTGKIECTSLADEFAQRLPDFEQIARTFQFQEPQ